MRKRFLFYSLGVVLTIGFYFNPNSMFIEYVFKAGMPGIPVLLLMLLELLVMYSFYWVPSWKMKAIGDARNFIPFLKSSLLNSILILAGIQTVSFILWLVMGSISAISVMGICAFSIIMFAFIWYILNELLNEVNAFCKA